MMIDRIHSVPSPVDEAEADCPLWRHGDEDFRPTFSATNTWNLTHEHHHRVPWSKLIWFTQAVPRFSFFTWLPFKDKLSTGERTRSWGIVQSCRLCGEPNELVGSLLGMRDAPDCTDTASFLLSNRLSQFMHRPTDDHWQAVKRVLRYLAGTQSHGIFLSSRSPISLHAFSDADWAGDVDDFVSTNAFIVYLGTTPVAWTSKKQTGVARSSTEAEYRSVANTAAELSWVCSLLTELGVTFPSTPVIYCDNLGATYLSANPVFHSRMKYLALDFHFVRQNV